MNKKLKAAAEKIWRDFDSLNSEKKEQFMDHDFAFYIEGSGGYDETMRFIIDGHEEIIFGGGMAGPDSSSFVQSVTHMKAADILEIGWSYEPGECDMLFSRRKDLIYFQKAGAKKGYYFRYAYFVKCITEGFERPCGGTGTM